MSLVNTKAKRNNKNIERNHIFSLFLSVILKQETENSLEFLISFKFMSSASLCQAQFQSKLNISVEKHNGTSIEKDLQQ